MSAAVLTVLIALLLAELLVLPRPTQAVSIALAGRASSGAALFYVTNAESRAINLACLEVQVRASNDWKTVSKETSYILNRNAPKKYDWSGKLAAGAYRPVYVAPPTNGAWRLSLTYLREAGELTSRLAKILSSRPGGTVFDRTRHQVLSQEIAQ